MPKVTINEIDQSRYVVNSQRAPLIALTPIISSWGSTENAVLIQSETDFKNYFGTPLDDAIEGDITRNYALNLINCGVSLLAKRVEPTCLFEEGKKPSEPLLDNLYADMDKGVDPVTETITGYVSKDEVTPTIMYVKNAPGTEREYYCIYIATGAEKELPMHHEALATDDGALKVVPNDYVGEYVITESTTSGALAVVAKVTIEDVNSVASIVVTEGDYVKFENNTFVIAQEGDTGALLVVETMPDNEVSIYTVNKITPTLQVSVGQYVKFNTFDPTKEIKVEDVDLGGIVPEINTYVVTYDTYINNNIGEDGTLREETIPVTTGYNMRILAKAKYFGSYGNKVAIRFTKSNTNAYDILNREPKKTVTITTYLVTKRADAEEITDNIIPTSAIKSYKAVDSVTLRYDDLKLEDSINKLNEYLDEFSLLSELVIEDADGNPLTTIEQFEKFVDSVDFKTGQSSNSYFILMNGKDYFTEVTNDEGEVIIAPTTTPLEQFYRTLEEEPEDATKSDINSINAFWDNFKDPYIYDFDFICASGFASRFNATRYNEDPVAEVTDMETNSKLHANMLKLAAYRGDAVACLDCPKQYNHIDLVRYFSTLSNSDTIYSYGTTHGPWCKIRDITNGNYLLIPGSFIFLGTIGTNLARNSETQIWYAPAGVARASTNLVEEPQYEIGATILNEWQNNVDDIAVRINPIMKILTYGYTIYGNATLMQDEEGYSKSALQSLGTRVLCNVVKKAIFSICVGLTFEPNDYILWAEFKTRLSTTLDQMKINGGISDYQIVMDETTVTDEAKNNLTVPGKVFISPTRPAEFFDIDFTITQAGVTFDESKSDVIG